MARVPPAPRIARPLAKARPWPESFADLGRAVLAARIDALRPFLDRDAAQLSVEEIHQFRVAVRRLRSSLWLLRPLDDERLAVAEVRAREAMSALGAVRDLDEQCHRMAPRGKVATHLRRRRQVALRAVRETFKRHPGSVWVQQLSAVAANPAGWATPIGHADGRAVAAALIRLRRRRLKRALRRLDFEAPPKRFHAARRRAKQFADALVDVAPFVGPVALPLRRDVQRLRSALGRLQDAVVTETEVAALARHFSGDRATQRRLRRLSNDNRVALRRARRRCLRVAADRSPSHWRRVRRALGPPADLETQS